MSVCHFNNICARIGMTIVTIIISFTLVSWQIVIFAAIAVFLGEFLHQRIFHAEYKRRFEVHANIQ